ncbi:MAG: hypothetical protein Q7P63_15070 [Verrucomicrobiota bacterium JB022]|nr:hypothetical protein [Verrucomicrobiota bacterium JB022]
MRWIDFENKKPTDAFEGWTPWAQSRWEAWLKKSAELLQQMEALNREVTQLRTAGNNEGVAEKLKARNKIIDDNCNHWGELKDWLLALSHGKCWFSEAKDVYNHWHVEHFRPKKQAKEIDGTEREGYWWLAFDYSNFRICGSVGNSKKGGWFPLHENSNCSTFDCRCEDSEAAYLIDPTKQCDVALISFQEDGNAIPLESDEESWDWKRADESIKRLRLNTYDRLPEERRKLANKLKDLIDRFLIEKSRYKPGVNEAPRGKMDEIARQIIAYLDEREPLSAYARWYVNTLLKKRFDQTLRQ